MLPSPLRSPRHCCTRAAVALLAVLGAAACGTTARVRAGLEPVPVAGLPEGDAAAPESRSEPVSASPSPAGPAGRLVAQAPPTALQDLNEVEQYDPWEPFNETMFEFNYRLDRYVLKPVANVYRKIVPEGLQILIANGFDNLRWVPRFVNSLLQGKLEGAGRELGRFVINSTLGLGGLFDPAKDYWGIQPSREDFGQTLGVWGNGPGPYLVLPFLDPMTVRDGVGRGVDAFLDPLSYLLPFVWERLAMRVGETVNDRALNYELFQGVEETTLDLYSSVRHFYLQRRERLIRE